MNFIESEICLSRQHCRMCLTNDAFRKNMNAPEGCPFGVKVGSLEPSLPAKTINLAGSVSSWVKSGLPICSKEVLSDRFDICKGCEFWDQSGFTGTGKCQKCGCSTQAKLRMATEKCPIDKWMQVEVRQSD